jgi:hypothetical protein
MISTEVVPTGSGRFRMARRLLLLAFGVWLAAASWGCKFKSPAADARGVDVSELPGTSYGVTIEDDDGAVALLGKLRFDAVSSETVMGAGRFETWGEQPQFPDFDVNTGQEFPDGGSLAVLSGIVFGDTIILRIPFPQGDRALGIVIDDQDGRWLFGSVVTLPDRAFSGRMQALQETAAP